MGREVKRVPLDFSWPLDKTWDGYLMPETLREPECTDCGGEGLSREARAIAGTFYPHMIPGDRETQEALAWHDKIGQAEVDNLIEKGRLRTWVRPGEGEERGRWESRPRSAAEVNETQRSGGAMAGRDAINRGVLTEFRCERLGIPHLCETCKGHGTVEAYAGQRAEAEAWECAEPPEGEGWQLWETVSEGSPISPVFQTPEALAEWMASGVNKRRMPYGYETALRFVLAGWAPSAVAVGGDVVDGATRVGSREG